MDKKVILGGLAGSIVILLFSISLLLILNSVFTDLLGTTIGVLLSSLVVFIAPTAGGFVAGLIGTPKPLQAGLIAGLTSSTVIFFAWLVMAGFALDTVLSGIVIVFVWVILARVAAGLAKRRN